MNAVTVIPPQQGTQIAQPRQQFDFSPQTFEQALTFCDYLADSDLVPKDFKGKPVSGLDYNLTALAGLSLQRTTGRTPVAPSNEDRLRAFRACVRPEIGNTRVWDWIKTKESKK